MSRFALLRPDWLLRGYSDRPGVLANWRSGEARSLAAAGAYVARSCDGHTDFESPFFLPKHLATLDLMIEEDLAEECASGAELDPRQRFREAPNRYIQYTQWAVTGRCNLRCRHCYMDAPSGRYGELSSEAALALVDQFVDANVQRLHLTGGEPLLRADFWDLAGALTEHRIAIHQISTNGVLLDDEALQRLRDLEADPILHFSLDGVGTHDAMRGCDGAESAAVAAIRRAADAGFRVSVTSCLDSLTRDGMLPALDLLVDAGARSWHVTAPQAIGCWTTASTGLSLDEQAAVCEPLLHRWLALDRPLLMTLCGLYAGAPGEYVPPQEPLHRCTPDDLHCGALFDDTAYVMPNGQLIPCPRFIGTPFETALPSLLDVSLSEAWANEGLRSLLGVTKSQVLAHNPECAACDEFGECGAGCWATAYAATGDVFGRDPVACALWKSPYRRRLEGIAASTV
jgi:radical SAM protein with 4Fe4S-binding SPASM domain